jgi:hypothetical protein
MPGLLREPVPVSIAARSRRGGPVASGVAPELNPPRLLSVQLQTERREPVAKRLQYA